MPEVVLHPASYKDPSGFVFSIDGRYYRQVNKCFAGDYALLKGSGLYDELCTRNWLLPHEEIHHPLSQTGDWHLTLMPRPLTPWTYPDEWCPSQLKAAALHTLKIMQAAINFGMVLKDATPGNVQFVDGVPVLIDTLSLERYDPSKPWVAYRQFCECFLFPLFLHHYAQLGTGPLLRAFPDGISAAGTKRLLPLRSVLRVGAWMHVQLLASVKSRQAGADGHSAFSKEKLTRLLEHLESVVKSLRTVRSVSAWAEYYQEDILSQRYLADKQLLFTSMVKELAFDTALDIGANNGIFSFILAKRGARVAAIDSDWPCVEAIYETSQRDSVRNVLPLCTDVSPETRGGDAGLASRFRSDLVVALAVVHHLLFGKQLPLGKVASLLASLTIKHLIVEFIPLEDPKVQQFLSRMDRYHQPYDRSHFEEAFARYFDIISVQPVDDSVRLLYLMRKKPGA